MSEKTNDKLKGPIKERATDSRISCEAAWQVAGELGLPKQEFRKAADDLGIKIFGCQLGCF